MPSRDPSEVPFNKGAHEATHDPRSGRIVRWQSVPTPGISMGGELYPLLNTGLVSWGLATMDDEDAPADVTAELLLDGVSIGELTIASGDRLSDTGRLGDFWDRRVPVVVSITDDGGLVGRLAASLLVAGL